MYLSRLTIKDREWLEDLLKRGRSLIEIAKRMDRSYSCIRQEIAKAGGRDVYTAVMADHLAKQRRNKKKVVDAHIHPDAPSS